MTQEQEKLLNLCKESNRYHDKYEKRLLKELKEIHYQAEEDYFLGLIGKKFPCNENNLLVAYLLDLVDDFDEEKEYAWVQGELPDAKILAHNLKL